MAEAVAVGSAAVQEGEGIMATFILVPGAMHPAWCWHRIVPLLEQGGHRAIAIDLPGTGEDRSIDRRDATLAIWADHVADQVRRAEGPVLLTGHSRGGLVISEAAERVPDELTALIYVTAILPVTGEPLTESREARTNMTPQIDADGCMIFPADMATHHFYNRCSADDVAAMFARLFPEPMAPLSTPPTITPGRWGRVPRAFIECSDDNALTLAYQRSMQAAAPCDPVITLDADHSPFLCAPEALADAMLRIAEHFVPAGATV
jgi:pimeloyl-ACP methyl ester carboxylesterase